MSSLARLALAFGVMSVAIPSAHALTPIRLTSDQGVYPVGRYMEVLEDKDGSYRIEKVVAPPLSKRFKRPHEEVPNYGFTDSTYWIRFDLYNTMKTRQLWMLELGYAMLDRVELYLPGPGGGFDRRVSGDTLPFYKREIANRHVVFRIETAPGQRMRVHLRVTTTSSMQLPLTLYTPTAFIYKVHTEQWGLGLYYGTVLVMFFYNFFVFLSIRDRSYLWAVAYIGLFGLFELALNGLAFEYLWPNAIWWANQCVPVLLCLSSVFALQFARSFLATQKYLSRFDKVLQAFMVLNGLFAVISLLVRYPTAIRLSVGLVLTFPVLVVTPAIIQLRRGFRSARFYLIAWAAFLVGIILIAMTAFGWLPSNFITGNGMQIGSSLNVVLLSFALADRINIMKQDMTEAQEAALDAQAQALEIQQEATETLQQEVSRQTEALRASNRQLQEADEQKTRFYQNISHELRTPLTVLLAPLEELQASDGTTLTDETRHKVEIMDRSAHRLLRLVNQLLDLSRLESGRGAPIYEDRDVSELVKPIVEGFQPLALAKSLTLELRTSDKLPRAFVDPDKLEKVVINLLSNACKFTDPGGTVVVRLSSGDGHLYIRVMDSGIGIEAEDLDRIFDRFSRVGEGAETQDGTGIGLALAKELAAVCGGSLGVESEKGFGSTFTLTLPLGKDHIADESQIRQEARARATAREAEAASKALLSEVGTASPDAQTLAAHHAAAAGEATASPSGTASAPGTAEATRPAHRPAPDPGDRPLVLVVEDNADMRGLIREICQPRYDVIEAASGEEALAQLETQTPALVISDVMMPGMDGYELLARIRDNPDTVSLPVILVTARAGQEMRISGLESGASDYLTKPFNARELLARTDNLIRLNEQGRELADLNQELRDTVARLEREVVDQTAQAERSRQLAKYLPPDLVHSVMEEGADPGRSLERRRLTLVGLELRGFDELLRTLEPEDLAAMLNGYLSAVTDAVFGEGGTLLTVLRDRIIAAYGAPRSDGAEADAAQAARLGEVLRTRAREVCDQWRAFLEGGPPSPTVLLHSGYATVGHFGSESRREYAAVGVVVDETHELLGAVDPGVVSCTSATNRLLPSQDPPPQSLGEWSVTGRTQPIQVYTIAAVGRWGDTTPGLATSDRGPAITSTGTFSAARRVSGAVEVVRPDPAEITNLPTRVDALAPGSVIGGRYQLTSLRSGSSQSAVFEARDQKLDVDVAIKLVPRNPTGDPRAASPLLREVRLARLIHHRNIARLHDVGEFGPFDFVTMELIRGERLAHRLAAGHALPQDLTVDVLRQLCSGLAAAHGAGVVHRNLKPSNIMLEQTGRVVMLEFGIARWSPDVDRTATEHGEVLGSPHYVAPEQIEDQPGDARTDIYSLGVIAFEMGTGRPPFVAEDPLAVLKMHLEEPPPDPLSLNPELSPRLAALILRCLAKNPAERFDSTTEVVPLLASLPKTEERKHS